MADYVGIDLYELDLSGPPDWVTYWSAGDPWRFAILKATQGTSYAPQWFLDNWPAVRAAAGDRYAKTAFRGCYHYLDLNGDGETQANYYLDFVERAGGWGDGDFAPIVDVENASNGSPTSDQVISCVGAFAARCLERTLRRPILYGGSLLRDLQITDHMGCSALWTARYASTLDPSAYTSIGWSVNELFAWQYCGTDSQTGPDGFPTTSPLGNLDISALTWDGGGDAAIDDVQKTGRGFIPLVAPAVAGILYGLWGKG